MLISKEFLIYFSLELLFFILMLTVSKKNIIIKIINYDWGNLWWVKIIDYTARVLIIILFCDEIGFFLKEWDYNLFIFNHFRMFLNLPGVKHLILLANYFILLTSIYTIMNKYFERLQDKPGVIKYSFSSNNEFIEYKKIYSAITAFIFLSISNLIWIVQCIQWNEFNIGVTPLFSLLFCLQAIMVVMPLIVLITLIKKSDKIDLQYIRNASYYFSKNRLYFLLSILFLTLSQTMITKILVLLPLIERFKNLGIKLVALILPKEKISEEYFIPLKGANNWRIFNFLFLTTSSFILLVFWQLAITPFPPLNAFYPKAYTISLFYTLYILLYFLLFTNDKLLKIKSIIWIFTSIFILYGLPIIQPDLFVNLNEVQFKSSYFLKDLYVMNFLKTFIILIFSFHILAIFVFYNIFKLEQQKNKLFTEGYENKKLFRYYFFFSSYLSTIALILFSLLFFFLISGNELIRILITYKFIDDKTLYFISFLPITILLILNYLRNTPKQIYNEINKNFGKKVNERILGSNRYLKLYKIWNNNSRSFLGFLLFCFVFLLLNLLSYFIVSIVPNLLTNSKYKFQWRNEVLLQENIYQIEGNKKAIICVGVNGVYCLDKVTGKLKWQKERSIPAVSIIEDSLIWIIDHSQISLINNDGKNLYNKLISDHNRKDNHNKNASYEIYRRFGNDILLKKGTDFFLINGHNGKAKFHFVKIKSPLPVIKGGPVIWRNARNEIWIYNKKPKKVPNTFFYKDIKQIVSFSDIFLIITNDSTLCYNYEGHKKWANINFISKKLYAYSDYLNKDSLIIFAINFDSIYGLSKTTGEVIWKTIGNTYSLKTSAFNNNDLLSKNKKGILLFNKDLNMFNFIDYSGSTKYKYFGKEIFGPRGYVTLIDDEAFYTMSLFSFTKYSTINNEYMFKDTYSLNIQRKYPKLYDISAKNNLMLTLNPTSILIDSNNIYWSTFKGGVFAIQKEDE